MTKELEDLVSDARYIALTAKISDSTLDSMLQRANRISGKLTCTREYQRDVEKLLAANNKLERRKGLLEELQKENRMIKSYEEENSMLRDQLEKSYATLDEVVSRHRQIMHRVQTDRTYCHLTPAMLQKICDSSFVCDVSSRNEQYEQAQQLMDVMRYCEMIAQRDTELFARIVRENRNLRELLNYASISDPNIIAHFRKSMQEYEKEQKKRAESRREFMDDSFVDEDEEDEDTSVLFNRSSLSQGNSTIRMVSGTMKRGGGGGEESSTSRVLEDVLAGIDELSEESDAETVIDRDANLDGSFSQDENDGDKPAADVIVLSPAVKPEGDADSGTASSLSSSPASTSSSEGENGEQPSDAHE